MEMTASGWNRSARTGIAVTALLTVAAAVTAQVPVPTFDKVFNPGTIGPGSVSTLRFDVTNQGATPVTGLAFTDVLPAGVVIANPANAATTCGGTLSAPEGGGTITFGDGILGAAASCSVSVDVTSGTLGTHMNVSGDLTSSAGNSGTASADLTVATNRPGFSKSFSPSSVPLGGRSTLTFTIDNTANPLAAALLTFADVLPVAMVVAGPADATTTCSGGVLTAAPGTGIISFSGGLVAAMSSCTVDVDVIGGAVGLLGNTSGELTSAVAGPVVSSGKASATLEVTVDPISLIKSFTDDPVPPGGTVTLEFTITNFDRFDSATNISFTDDLDAALSGLVSVGLPVSDVCGAGSSLSGTSFLTLTGGNLAAGSSCTFSTTLQIPAAAATGAYLNTTSTITADIGGLPVVGSPALEVLFVSPAPVLTKSFTNDPVGAGETVNLNFTVTNTSTTSAATNIQFIDDLTVFLPFPVSATLPPAPCGAGSTLSLISLGFDQQGLQLTGGDLGAGGSCSFDVGIDIPVGMPSGNYTNVTTPISATVGGETAIGEPAVDDLVVVAGPRLLKEFTDDPVDPGATVILEFTLSHDEFAPADATGITFTDDLAAVLTGLTANLPPSPDPPCGTGSSLTGSAGDTLLTFSGGSLTPGSSCTFSVTLDVPVGAAPGSYTNNTSIVTATVLGQTTTESAATDDLVISTLNLSKEFTNDPVVAGENVNLRFTLDNPSPIDATTISFSDNLAAVLPGTPDLSVVTVLPMPACGGTLSLIGPSLSFAGGSVTAGAQCFFDVTVMVPAGTADGTYINATSTLSSNLGVGDLATDALTVNSMPLAFSKQFADDPVAPGDTATLEFSITNLNAVQSATAISFTDDLDAALAGLAAVGLPLSDVCGAGSQISGTSVLTLAGGSLPADGTCTFSVMVQVPGAAAAGSYTNTTSQITGTVGGVAVTGDPATDDLSIGAFSFSKTFGGPVPAGGTTTLEFTIQNLDAGAAATGIAFTDDLDAVVPGMVAIGLPTTDVCGTGSTLTGTSTLNFTGGNLPPGGSCTFSVDVQIPSDAPVGTFPNTTSDLSQGGFPVGEPATADIVVEAAQLANAIPVTNPLGTFILIALVAAAAVWRLRWGA